MEPRAGTPRRYGPRVVARRTVPTVDHDEGVRAIDPIVGTALAFLGLGTGLACLALALTRIGDRGAQLTHGVMGLAMAGMLWPWGDPVPGWSGVLGFTVIGAWFAARVLRGDRSSAGGSGATARHLAISSAAMVLMYLVHGHHTGPSGAAGSGPHAGQAVSGGANLVVLPLALVLAGYFVWHTWTCVDRARAGTRVHGSGAHEPGATRTRPSVRMEPVAHGVMSALMAAMFLGVV